MQGPVTIFRWISGVPKGRQTRWVSGHTRSLLSFWSTTRILRDKLIHFQTPKCIHKWCKCRREFQFINHLRCFPASRYFWRESSSLSTALGPSFSRGLYRRQFPQIVDHCSSKSDGKLENLPSGKIFIDLTFYLFNRNEEQFASLTQRMSLKIRFKTNGGHGALLNRFTTFSQHSVLKGATTALFGAKNQVGKMQGASYIIEVESGDFVEKRCSVCLPKHEFPVTVDQLIVALKYRRVLEKTATKDKLKITAIFSGRLANKRTLDCTLNITEGDLPILFRKPYSPSSLHLFVFF